MLSVPAAFKIIMDCTPTFRDKDVVWVSIAQAHQRVLAQTIKGELDYPYWDNSAMDGYAIRYEDTQPWQGSSMSLEVAMESSAGSKPEQALQPGQAARIFTGAMMPEGADTIVMQEDTQVHQGRVEILQAPQPRQFVRQKGEYYQAGTELLSQGIRLGATELAILATIQCIEVPVFREPHVAVLSTGNELIAPEQTLSAGQIIDSNRFVLSALVKEAGAKAHCDKAVGDRLDSLKQSIDAALDSADVVISSGGVSVGDYDFVEQALTELGGTLHIQSVAIKPGKPLTFATFERGDRTILYFGLPGNPVSAPVGFWRFVKPSLLKLSGLTQEIEPKFVQARSRQNLTSHGKRETYLWGRLLLVDGVYEFELAQGSHSSGNLMNLAQTNGLGVISCDRPCIQAGELMSVMKI